MKTFLQLLIFLAVVGLAAGGAFLAGRKSGPQVYTCPMDEDAEVRAAGPGPCPKCGMDLVPLADTYHKGVTPDWVLAQRRSEGNKAHGPAPAGAHPGAPTPQALPKPAAPSAAPGAAKRYYCTMHPDYISDRPGDCPICNMTLTFLDESLQGTMSAVPGMARVTLDPDRRQKIGIRLGVVRKGKLAKTIRAPGIVAYDEGALSAFSLKVGGWVEDLRVRAAGDVVAKGDVVLKLYSPEILEAQQAYLIAKDEVEALDAEAAPAAREAAAANLRSARDRLLLWDLTEDQIARLEAARAPDTRVAIHAKTGGVVTSRAVVLGAYVQPGATLLELADLSAVWINADIFEQDIPYVALGAAATVTLAAAPDRPIAARVAFLYPYANQAARTLRVRLEVPNPDGALRPGMYAQVELAASLGEHLLVPDDAVFDTGARRLIFVDLGEGAFEPREVVLGPSAGGLTAVAEGLAEGETIAASGTFFIDAESRLRGAFLQSGGTR